MEMLKEVMEILSRKTFDEARRVEVRKHISMKSESSLHSIIFKVDKDICGYEAIVYIPELIRDNENNSGFIFAARHRISGRLEDTKFENAKFNNYLSEVKPYIKLFGNLLRRTRRL